MCTFARERSNCFATEAIINVTGNLIRFFSYFSSMNRSDLICFCFIYRIIYYFLAIKWTMYSNLVPFAFFFFRKWKINFSETVDMSNNNNREEKPCDFKVVQTPNTMAISCEISFSIFSIFLQRYYATTSCIDATL